MEMIPNRDKEREYLLSKIKEEIDDECVNPKLCSFCPAIKKRIEKIFKGVEKKTQLPAWNLTDFLEFFTETCGENPNLSVEMIKCPSHILKEFIKRLKFRDLRMTFTAKEWYSIRMFIIRYEEALDKKIDKLAGDNGGEKIWQS